MNTLKIYSNRFARYVTNILNERSRFLLCLCLYPQVYRLAYVLVSSSRGVQSESCKSSHYYPQATKSTRSNSGETKITLLVTTPRRSSSSGGASPKNKHLKMQQDALVVGGRRRPIDITESAAAAASSSNSGLPAQTAAVVADLRGWWWLWCQ